MVAHLLDRMEIQDIAELWNQETDQPPSIYVQVLSEFLHRKYAVQSWLPSATIMTREDLRAFCKESQIDLPRFWFGARVSTAAAEDRCRKWLTDKTSEDKCMSKKECRELAIKEIEGLSKRAFDRAWYASAPAAWKQAGRPKKS